MATETLTSCLYDSVVIDHEVVYMFQSPIGVNGKTYLDTNMTHAGTLPANNTFIVKRLFFSVPHPTVLTFYVGCCEYGRFMLWGDNKISIERILLQPLQNFMWEISATILTGKVTINMLGTLTRPVC